MYAAVPTGWRVVVLGAIVSFPTIDPDSIVFRCPRCNQPLGQRSPSGVIEPICASCGYAFHILTGTVESLTSRLVVLAEPSMQRGGAYARDYELRLNLHDDRLMAVRFETRGRSESIVLQRGDLVSAIAMLEKNGPGDVVEVIDHTTAAAFRIKDPASRAGWIANAAAGLAGILIAATTLGPLGIWAIVVGAGAAVAVYVATLRALEPKRSLVSARSPQLLASQALLEQKMSLVRERRAIETELRDRAALRERLLGLHGKMKEVGTQMYGPRMETLMRAVGLLDQQAEVDRELLETYDGTVKMLDIEIESGVVIGAMPDDAAFALDERKQQLADLRERHRELTRLISANEEVERALQA